MFTPSTQTENELLHKLTHGALQLVTHTTYLFSLSNVTGLSRS